MKLILIGFMGAGKSSVAKSIGKKLSIGVIEMDDLIMKRSKKSINQIFNEDGETRFRELEIEVAKSLVKKNKCIISAGGGVVINKINIDYLKERGKIIFLKTSFLEISRRLKDIDNRPLFKDKEAAKKLFISRQKLYEEYADLTVSTDGKSVEKVAYEIISQN